MTQLLPSCAVLVLLAFGPWTPGVAAQQDLTELARKTKDAVVHLEIFDRFGAAISTGTGFFVTDTGWIVTNHHVVEGASRVEAVMFDGERLAIDGVWAVDKGADLAVLQSAGDLFDPLTLHPTSLDLEMGEPVVVIGGPMGFAGSLTNGVVAAIRQPEDPAFRGEDMGDVPLLQITAAISPGSSGSPVMNSAGEVLGVVVSQMISGQNINFAVPVEALRTVLDSIDPSLEPEGLKSLARVSRGGYLRNLGISLLFFVALGLGYRHLTRG